MCRYTSSNISSKNISLLCIYGATHNLQSIYGKVGVPVELGNIVFLQEAPGFNTGVFAFVFDALQRDSGRHIIGCFEDAAKQDRNIGESFAGTGFNTGDDQMAEVSVGLPKSK